jgi:hypothetical protein
MGADVHLDRESFAVAVVDTPSQPDISEFHFQSAAPTRSNAHSVVFVQSEG